MEYSTNEEAWIFNVSAVGENLLSWIFMTGKAPRNVLEVFPTMYFPAAGYAEKLCQRKIKQPFVFYEKIKTLSLSVPAKIK